VNIDTSPAWVEYNRKKLYGKEIVGKKDFAPLGPG
jgi:hypothetical protein